MDSPCASCEAAASAGPTRSEAVPAHGKLNRTGDASLFAEMASENESFYGTICGNGLMKNSDIDATEITEM
jgi:hypothetical protein